MSDDESLEERIEAVEQDLVESLNEERGKLWHEEAWMPPFVDHGGFKALDIERLRDDLDDEKWAYYRAGLIQGYGEASQKIREALDDDQ